MKSSNRQLTLALLGALSLLSTRALAGDVKEAAEPFGRLTVDEVQKFVDAKQVQVFDNNGEDRFKRGRVPGAKRVSAADLAATDLPADKDAKLVFYCGNEQCGACHKAAKK